MTVVCLGSSAIKRAAGDVTLSSPHDLVGGCLVAVTDDVAVVASHCRPVHLVHAESTHAFRTDDGGPVLVLVDHCDTDAVVFEDVGEYAVESAVTAAEWTSRSPESARSIIDCKVSDVSQGTRGHLTGPPGLVALADDVVGETGLWVRLPSGGIEDCYNVRDEEIGRVL